VVLLATLAAVAGTYFYKNYTEETRDDTINKYNEAIADFDVNAMEQVVQLSEQLTQAETLVNTNFSLAEIFTLLERTTVASVQFTNLSMSRPNPTTILVEADISTDSFDSVLFQRQIFGEADSLQSVELTDVKITFAGADAEGGATTGTGPKVTFAAEFTINPEQVEVPQSTSAISLPLTTPVVGTSTATSS
jgi:hypothetical protein